MKKEEPFKDIGRVSSNKNKEATLNVVCYRFPLTSIATETEWRE